MTTLKQKSVRHGFWLKISLFSHLSCRFQDNPKMTPPMEEGQVAARDEPSAEEHIGATADKKLPASSASQSSVSVVCMALGS